MYLAVAAIEWVPVETNELAIYGTRSGWVFIVANAEDPNVSAAAPVHGLI